MNSTELYKDAASKFEEMKSAADLLAKEIVWTGGRYFNVVPFEFERAGFRRGKILKSLPKETKNKICYVFDERGKIIAIKEGNNIDENFTYIFYQHFDDHIYSFRFNNSGAIINARTISVIDKVIVHMERCANLGTSIENYNYQGTVLGSIGVSQRSGDVEQDFKVLFFYNSDGSLKQIKNVHPNGYEEVVYK